ECGYRVTVGGILGWVEPICDSHLVEVGVTGEGEQAGLLVLPPEPTDTVLPRRFGHRNGDQGASLTDWLGRHVVLQGAIRDCFHTAVAECTQGNAERTDWIGVGASLLNSCGEGAVVDERAARRIYKRTASIDVASSEFRNLTGAADVRSLMALRARVGVVARTEPLGNPVHLFKGAFDYVEFCWANKAVVEVIG